MPENQHYYTRNKDDSYPRREGTQDHKHGKRYEDKKKHDERSHGDEQSHATVQKETFSCQEESSYSSTSYYNYAQSHPKSVLYNIKYATSSRGICQIMEFFLTLLIIICAGVPYSNRGRYQDIASLGGLYQYYYGGSSAFTGAEAQKVQQLDDQFYQLKLPPYIYSMLLAGVIMIYVGAVFCLGIFRMPYRFPPLLIIEALVDALICLGFIPSVTFFFIKLQDIYNNSVCKDREAMYKSKGHLGFECNFNGADIAVGLFGVLGVIIFLISAVLAIKAFRRVRKMRQRQTQDDNL